MSYELPLRSEVTIPHASSLHIQLGLEHAIMIDEMATDTAKHVIYQDGKWVVRTQGQPITQAAETYDTQLEAVRAARAIAKKSSSDLVIHSQDGRIRNIDSYQKSALVSKLLPEVNTHR